MGDEENIKLAFPGLATDPVFRINSKVDVRYNCIAWSLFYSDRWVWPPSTFTDLDGVLHFWPKEVPMTSELQAFIELYKEDGYEECKDSNHEEGYRKIAIYSNTLTGVCTHAARELRNGTWVSKLGQNHDIIHNDPYTLECKTYGSVSVIMRKKID